MLSILQIFGFQKVLGRLGVQFQIFMWLVFSVICRCCCEQVNVCLCFSRWVLQALVLVMLWVIFSICFWLLVICCSIVLMMMCWLFWVVWESLLCYRLFFCSVFFFSVLLQGNLVLSSLLGCWFNVFVMVQLYCSLVLWFQNLMLFVGVQIKMLLKVSCSSWVSCCSFLWFWCLVVMFFVMLIMCSGWF